MITKMDVDLRYAYVKFISEDDSPPIYVLICIDVAKKYLAEFKIINKMIPELTMEYHNDFMVINCMPIKMLVAFKILMRFITMRESVHIDNIDEEINFLNLLCKLGNRQQIDEILDSFKIHNKTFIRLLDQDFDAKNFFTETRKINICISFAKYYPQLDKEKYLNIYGIPFLNVLPEHENFFPSYKKFYQGHFPQIRIHDRRSKTYYHSIKLGNKALLFNPQGYNLACWQTKKRMKKSQYDTSSSSETDDERTSESNMRIIKLPREFIGGTKINNYVLDVVDVNFMNNIVPMEIVRSGCLGRAQIFKEKYKMDYEKLSLGPEMKRYYITAQRDAFIKYAQDHIYIPPKSEDFYSSSKRIIESDSGSDEPIKKKCRPSSSKSSAEDAHEFVSNFMPEKTRTKPSEKIAYNFSSNSDDEPKQGRKKPCERPIRLP